MANFVLINQPPKLKKNEQHIVKIFCKPTEEEAKEGKEADICYRLKDRIFLPPSFFFMDEKENVLVVFAEDHNYSPITMEGSDYYDWEFMKHFLNFLDFLVGDQDGMEKVIESIQDEVDYLLKYVPFPDMPEEEDIVH